jgi:allophanate hydrolase subunit 2
VLFLADHPVTGGYPVVAVLTARSADLAAQLVAGQQVRLRRASSRP